MREATFFKSGWELTFERIVTSEPVEFADGTSIAFVGTLYRLWTNYPPRWKVWLAPATSRKKIFETFPLATIADVHEELDKRTLREDEMVARLWGR